jgi:hypothetical protein
MPLPKTRYLTVEEARTSKSSKYHRIRFYNGALIGDILPTDDGIYHFWPHDVKGAWPGYLLKEISEVLDIMNEEVYEHLNRDKISDISDTTTP